jgi:hypothetical protein
LSKTEADSAVFDCSGVLRFPSWADAGAQTKEFYSRISTDLSLIEFIEWLSAALEKDHQLIEFRIKPSPFELLLRAIRKFSLEENTELIFGDEFKQAVEKRDIKPISAIYVFLDNNDLRELFNERFGLNFSDRVKALLSEQCPIEALITELRNARDFLTAFSPGSSFQEVVRTAFNRSLVQKSEYTSKSLAAFFNKGLPLTDDDIDIFGLHRPKDFFEAAYAYLLTKRIFSWGSIDIVQEEKLIQCFKEISPRVHRAL